MLNISFLRMSTMWQHNFCDLRLTSNLTFYHFTFFQLMSGCIEVLWDSRHLSQCINFETIHKCATYRVHANFNKKLHISTGRVSLIFQNGPLTFRNSTNFDIFPYLNIHVHVFISVTERKLHFQTHIWSSNKMKNS